MLSSVFLFLDIGGGEFLMILFVALLLFGGDKLPELAKGLGKGIRDFKDASDGVKREINNQIDSYESKKKDDDAAKKRAENSLLAENKIEEATEEEIEAYKAPETHVPNTMPVSESYSVGDQYSDDYDGYNPEVYSSNNDDNRFDDTFGNHQAETNVSNTEPETENKETKV
jgi:sec-independent protein translocase protein TatA